MTNGSGITVTKVSSQETNDSQLFILSITADPDASLGNRSLLLTNPDGSHGPAAFGLLEVVTPGTLAKVEKRLQLFIEAADISLESVVSDEVLKILASEIPGRR